MERQVCATPILPARHTWYGSSLMDGSIYLRVRMHAHAHARTHTRRSISMLIVGPSAAITWAVYKEIKSYLTPRWNPELQ